MYLAAILSCLSLLWVPALSTGEVVSSTAIPGGSCSNAVVYLMEKYFGAKSVQGIAEKMLGKVQDECASNKCPQVDVASNCNRDSTRQAFPPWSAVPENIALPLQRAQSRIVGTYWKIAALLQRCAHL